MHLRQLRAGEKLVQLAGCHTAVSPLKEQAAKIFTVVSSIQIDN